MRNRIHRHRCGRDVAVDATLHLRVETRRAIDQHRVERFGRTEVCVKLQAYLRIVADVPDSLLADASDVARVDGEQFAVYFVFRDPWAYVIGDARQGPPHRIADHLNRFREPDVADSAGFDLLLELLACQAGADLLLERNASHASIL